MAFELNVGSIDEKGYLAGMERRGYSEPKCLLELIANSLDAQDGVIHERGFTPTIAFKLQMDDIRQIDNGNGMDADNIAKMFAMHRENHSRQFSRGVSGIGAKPALSILSKKTEVIIFTRRRDGVFIKVTVPWDKIHRDGVYAGMVRVTPMTEDEQSIFFREREERGMLNGGFAHGTTICIKYSDDLADLLRSNFLPISHDDALKDPLDRIGVVFGSDNVSITLNDYMTPDEPFELQKYDYFGASNGEFYTGKSEHTIEHIRSDTEKKDRFILSMPEGPLEIRACGRGFSKTPDTVTEGRAGYRTIGTFQVVCGMRYDTRLFDPDAPSAMTAGAYAGTYNESNLNIGGVEEHKMQEPFLCSYKLRRNNQVIGLIPPPDTNMSSARGNANSRLELMHVQAELRFNPVSTQDNRQDLVTGIQENKNQFNGGNVTKQLTRIIAYLRKMKANEILQFMESCRRQLPPEPPLPSPPVPSPPLPPVPSPPSPPLPPLPSPPSPPSPPLPSPPSPPELLQTTGADILSFLHTHILPAVLYTEQELHDIFYQALNELVRE